MSVAELQAVVADTVRRQVETTGAGRKLTAYDAAAVESLIRNIVGNVVQALATEEES